ncbi:DUF4169 family protein [Nitratireductor sp. L1-7-SE]|uniref:DUF4169 family protein n=1 Tax=Nitratireductor rhodophyticola TaxID=2854036 RepID=A0ABS7R5R0_9HYPH|nr:DUF4169 family protein [Nitratireductor rhodophyticola]MBY8915742.1 DUF4169 family protein [Nitratireductor rhodophyticola]MBY8919189.1 DUF4169 family protein [Nitratireductor rhodophyticola]
MGELVNLRQRRKRRAREEKEQRATENRIRHGRTRGECALEESAKAGLVARLDGHRREKSRDNDPR